MSIFSGTTAIGHIFHITPSGFEFEDTANLVVSGEARGQVELQGNLSTENGVDYKGIIRIGIDTLRVVGPLSNLVFTVTGFFDHGATGTLSFIRGLNNENTITFN